MISDRHRWERHGTSSNWGSRHTSRAQVRFFFFLTFTNIYYLQTMRYHCTPPPPPPPPPSLKTRDNAGQRRSANKGQHRPRTATQANNGQQQPTQANSGRNRPTTADKSQRRPTTPLGLVFLSVLFTLTKFYYRQALPLLDQTQKAHESQHRPMTGQRRPMTANAGCHRDLRTQ